jgi:hypothetical protein
MGAGRLGGLSLTWSAGCDREMPSVRWGPNHALDLLRKTRKRPFAMAETMQTAKMFVMAGVATLLMCCQLWRGRSNAQPQCPAASRPKSLHLATLSAWSGGLADLHMRDSCIVSKHHTRSITRGPVSVIEAVGYALPECIESI